MLPDSAHIQEEDARRRNRHGYSKHKPALPLYTEIDAAARSHSCSRSATTGRCRSCPDVEVEFINAGHLLGSAYARIRIGGKTILFGGDLGRYGRPVLPDPSPVASADVLLLESTYGDRHEPDDGGARLAQIINETVERRRQADHPVVRDRPRRGGALLAEAARETRADPGAAGVRRQPDGGRRAAVLFAARPTSSIADMRPPAARRQRVLHQRA